jgi:pimeloyl-ACP methyl ester carboxylesterase
MTRWLLLRGWTREARHWGAFPAELERALRGARVQAVDLPGNGRLAALPSPTRIADMVQSLRREPRETPVCLLGLSLGALVAIDWAHRHPAEVAACVLVNTSLRPFSAFYERLRPQTYAALVRLALFEPDTQAREAAILKLTSAAAAPAALVSERARYAAEWPVTHMNVIRQLLAAARYRAPEPPPRVPVLVVASRGDRLVDWRCSLELARRWQAPLALHASAGHDLALDDGPWLAARVAEWLRAA